MTPYVAIPLVMAAGAALLLLGRLLDQRGAARLALCNALSATLPMMNAALFSPPFSLASRTISVIPARFRELFCQGFLAGCSHFRFSRQAG
ncbi:MAG: hypothetical protein WCK85_07420 [Chlorobium sp.]